MKTKIILITSMILAGFVTGVLLMMHETSRELQISQAPPIQATPSPPSTPETPSSTVATATTPPPSTHSAAEPKPLKPAVATSEQKPPLASVPGGQGNQPPKEQLQDPVARMALAYVGMDPDAEAYWLEAINDPSLPAQERQDLIEDLNEDGLSDPKNPGPQDLPLILNRMQLIEEISPNAMDKVNSDAFKEAYKDLLNLANVVIGGGEPVK